MRDPSLPFIDLHRHLDGNVRLETIIELAAEHGVALPAADVEGLRPHVQILGERAADLMDFIGRFHWLTAVLVDLDACRRVAYENVEDAQREGLDYVELRFSPWFMAEAHGLDPAGVTEAVIDGVRAGCRDFQVPAQLIGILSRTYGAETCGRELEALLAHRDGLVALDLAGDEAGFPAQDFANHFRRARDADLRITVHAGEAAGPESMWSALRDLGAQRIGHGLAAGRDPKLVDHLVDQGIGLEVNLTSNIHISAVADYPGHPARDYLHAGIPLCLNTDDPAISGIDLAHEYDVAAPRAGFDADDLRQVQEHAVNMAFLSDRDRQALRAGTLQACLAG